MPKKAILVTYQPTTRLVVDVPEGMTLEQYLENIYNWSAISRIARHKMQEDLDNYLFGNNMSVEEDTEVPAKEDDEPDQDPEKAAYR